MWHSGGTFGKSGTEDVVKPWISVAACLAVMSCSNPSRDEVTFNCEATEQARPEFSRTVGFHFAEGYLFVRNETGTLDIDRRSGHFLFMQEGCEPDEDRVMTGLCTFD